MGVTIIIFTTFGKSIMYLEIELPKCQVYFIFYLPSLDGSGDVEIEVIGIEFIRAS